MPRDVFRRATSVRQGNRFSAAIGPVFKCHLVIPAPCTTRTHSGGKSSVRLGRTLLHLKITRGVLILAPGGSTGHSKDWTVTLENGSSPSAPRGAVATVGGGLASASEPRLRLRQGPPSGMVLLVDASGKPGRGRRGGGGGVWDPRVCVTTMARPDFPDGRFRFF